VADSAAAKGTDPASAAPTERAPVPAYPIPRPNAAAPVIASQPTSAAESSNIKAVKVTFTPAAQDQVAAEPQFTSAGLLAAVEGQLHSHKLLDEPGPDAGDTIEILIEDFGTHTTSNAVIFGYVLSTGTLKGKLDVLAPDGTLVRSSRIQTRSRLTQPAGADQTISFQPLYEGFADLTARTLTGAPEPVAVNH
jgi:hypothetical protein